MEAERSKLMTLLLTEQVADLCFYLEMCHYLILAKGFNVVSLPRSGKRQVNQKNHMYTYTQISMHVDVPGHSLTSGAVGDHSHGEVDLRWMQVWGRADGVVAWLQQGQLGEQQARW